MVSFSFYSERRWYISVSNIFTFLPSRSKQRKSLPGICRRGLCSHRPLPHERRPTRRRRAQSRAVRHAPPADRPTPPPPPPPPPPPSARGTAASAPAPFPARARAHRLHRHPGSHVARGGTSPPPAAAGTMIPIAGPRPSRAGRQHEMYTVRAPARARVRALGHQFAAVACWAQGEGLPAMSVAGTVGGAAQDRTPHLCARAALDLGRPLGP